ncbi:MULTISPECIES: permease prefix domain 1-containing protein [unclassified Sutcliffiella]|jgi:cation transport ATPase|uniref:permease prefix domain 1-containing protein n=1 Tax=unclassified Sutcliffiella TaxID=2837532 RepID=UPI0030CE59F5
MRNQSDLDKKIHAYVNGLFSGVGESQQLYDLKEELATNLKEKIADYKKEGMDESTAFKEAVSSMGDLSGLVDDMREVGQNKAKQAVYSSMTERIAVAGLITGILLIIFGVLTSAMLFFMGLQLETVTGTAIFAVFGIAIITYSMLTRETSKKYGMNKVRAIFYAVAIGLIAFSLYVAFTSGFATGEVYIAISSFMIFFIIGLGLWLGLLFTGTDRRKMVSR